MNFQRLFRAFLLTYNWNVKVNASREELINFFNTKFNSDSGVVGHSTWKTIYFMCPTMGGTLYNYSLIGFKGVIEENQPESTIQLKARFGQPFLFFYIIPALIFPTLYIFDIDGMRENLNWMNNHFLNIIVPPVLIWSAVMVYYQIKIGHAKSFIPNRSRNFKLRRTTTSAMNELGVLTRRAWPTRRRRQFYFVIFIVKCGAGRLYSTQAPHL